jgi:phage major head subunit gpT-like protein
MDLTPAQLDGLYWSFDSRFAAGYEDVAPFYEQLATVISSSGKQTTYHWALDLPNMREWIGEREVRNLAFASYTIVNKKFEETVELDKDNVSDAEMGLFPNMVTELGRAARKWPDQTIATLLEAGETTLAFDNQYFFDDDHVGFDNLFASTPLTPANFAAVRSAMRKYSGSSGRKLSVRPTHLIVPSALSDKALQIVQSEMIAPVGAFGINAAGGWQTNILRGTVDVITIDELTDDTSWYLADLSHAIKPMVFQMRKPPDFQQLTSPTDQNVFWRNKLIYGVDSRGNAGFTLPFLMAKAKA